MSIDMALCYSYRPSRKGSVGVRPYGAATPAMRKNFALFRGKAGMISRICPLLALFFMPRRDIATSARLEKCKTETG